MEGMEGTRSTLPVSRSPARARAGSRAGNTHPHVSVGFWLRWGLSLVGTEVWGAWAPGRKWWEEAKAPWVVGDRRESPRCRTQQQSPPWAKQLRTQTHRLVSAHSLAKEFAKTSEKIRLLKSNFQGLSAPDPRHGPCTTVF